MPAPGSGRGRSDGRSGTTWTEVGRLFASDGGAWDEFGTRVAIDGDTVLVGAPGYDYDAPAIVDTGAAYVFVPSGLSVSVVVAGDTAVEPHETLTATLSNPVGATIVHGTATGTIRNDDG